jgi:hypothetical protein
MLIFFKPFTHPSLHANNPHANAQALHTHCACSHTRTYAPTIGSTLNYICVAAFCVPTVHVQTGATKDLLNDAKNMAVCGIYDGGANGLFTGELSDIKVRPCRCAL